MTKEEIQKKRDNIRTSIRINIKKYENNRPDLLNKIIEKVDEYNNLTEQLCELGYDATITVPHLTREYWQNKDNYTKSIQYKQKDNIEKPNKVNTQSPPDWEKLADEIEHRLKSKNNYIITLAWSETKTQKPSIGAIENIKRYFNSMNMNELDNDFSDMGNRKEYMIKYEYIGEDSSFKIIKDSAQFMLDTLSITDYDKFNIAIFGKKVD